MCWLLAVLLATTMWFPDTTASFIAETLLYWVQRAVVTGGFGLVGGIIGLGLASSREILDQFSHLKKMFQSYVVVNRQRLKEENFFDDANAQKYCCEGVVGSDEEFMKLLNECFIAVCMVVFCILWGFGCMMLAVRAVSSEVSWTFTLIGLSAFINLGRVLHPILKFQFRQDLRKDIPRLAVIAQEMRKIEDPEYKLPAAERYVPPPTNQGRRAQRRQANQLPVAPVQVQVAEETPEEHANRKKALLVNYRLEKSSILASYPALSEPEPATTKNMWFIVMALAIWLCFWAWIALIILQRGFGVWLQVPASNSTNTTNGTNSTNTTNWSANTSWNWTHWNSTDYDIGLTDYRPLFLGLSFIRV